MSTSDIIGICERLENDLDYQEFCKYLITSFKDTTFDMMCESTAGNNKMSAEEFAKAKVYATLGTLPKLIREQV